MEFLRLISEIRTPILTVIMSALTFLGEQTFVIALVCFFYWCYNKQLAKKICLNYFISGLSIQALKLSFRIPRPWVIDPDFKPVESALGTATGYSFPSGHTQSATSLFSTLAFTVKNNILKALFVLTFILVGFSRMYLGVHTPNDVIVSMTISFIIAFIIHKFAIVDRFSTTSTAAFLVAFSSIISVYLIVLMKQPNAELNQFGDCFKAVGAGYGFALGYYAEPKFINFNEKSGSVSQKAVRYIIGIAITILLKSGLKSLLGSSLFADSLRYFILICFVTIIYPAVFSMADKSLRQN